MGGACRPPGDWKREPVQITPHIHMERELSMPNWLIELTLKYDWVHRVVYRFRCPYPVDGHNSARACFEAGVCGCDNARRFSGTQKRG